MSETQQETVGSLVLGRYRILRLLAKGGMGAVYLARVEGAAGFAKPVVVKRMLSHLSDVRDKKAQFVREAQILSNLRHPGIVNVIDFGKHEDAHVMVLEYVHGYNLGQWLKYCMRSGRPMPWETGIYIMLQVLSALHYAHTHTRSDGSRAGIIHRDISPGNILIDVDGNVMLADFGIARMDAEQTAQERTSEGMFKGKLPFAAPELFANETATPSADVYACGVLLYQVLSGANPFNAQDVTAIVQRVMTLVPEPISTLRADVPPELDEILAKTLAKRPQDRYVSAAEYAAALRGILEHSEAEVAAEMALSVREDFTAGLPRVLELHTLEELEEDWRRASTSPAGPPLMSIPPTINFGMLRMPLPISEETTVRETPARESPDRESSARDSTDRASPARGSAEREAARADKKVRGRGSRLIFTAIGVACLTAGIAVALVFVLRRPPQTLEPRYVVVESHSDNNSAQPETTQPPTSPVVGASATRAPAPSASITPPRVEPSHRDSSNNLSRTFAKRQGSIEGCFQQNAMSVSGAPELSIRFSIDAQGKVISAGVRPAAVAATALGQCLEAVARSTDFGLQEKPLVFSIPITAHAH
jgi:serine/threonine protein kinase